MTLRTVTIATGMIDVDLLRAVIALRAMASEVRRAARVEIPHRPRLTGQQVIADLRAIGRTVEAENVRHLQHADLWGRSETVHQLVERIGESGLDLPRQMRVDLRGAGAAMTEGLLNDSQVHAGFQQVGRVRMPQRILTLPMNRPPRSFSIVTIHSTANT